MVSMCVDVWGVYMFVYNWNIIIYIYTHKSLELTNSSLLIILTKISTNNTFLNTLYSL